jgi:hypothetical protein
MKHCRPIELARWQGDLARHFPGLLLRGLIHSDGCRVVNRVRAGGVEYSYPRYQFSNRSADIRRIFCDSCDWLEVAWKQSNFCTISVSRRADVAVLEDLVGPKT